MSDLTQKKCQVCEGGIPALEPAQVAEMLKQVPGWAVSAGGTEISRAWKFRNFHETMEFVNALAWIAHREDHHPDLEVGYSRCLVRYSTHAVGGLTENDFICAAKINALIAD